MNEYNYHQPKEIFSLSGGKKNVLKGKYPNRYYDSIDTLELHYFQALDPRAQALVYPGGGYINLVHDKEGIEIAHWLNQIGIDAYVITHRLPGTVCSSGGVYSSTIALDDSLECLKYISQRSSLPLFHVGLSSGGHLAGVVSCHNDIIEAKGSIIAYAPLNANHRCYKSPVGKPDYMPIQKQEFYDSWAIGIESEPHGIPSIPIFLAYPLHDDAVPIDHALNLLKTAHLFNKDVEAHIYSQAPHGFALRDLDGTHDQWTNSATRWIGRILSSK